MSGSDLFLRLNKEDQQRLLKLYGDIEESIESLGEKAWYHLQDIILPKLVTINFDRIAHVFEASPTYYRIPIPPEPKATCIILFLFKPRPESSVILLHTYPNIISNRLIYSDSVIENRMVSPDTLIQETLPHTHNSFCHSCVAWIKGSARVTEETYEETPNKKLSLIQQIKRPLYSWSLDDSEGSIIHSISVSFV